MYGPESQKEAINRSVDQPSEVTYENPQQAAESAKKEGAQLTNSANAELDTNVVQLGISDEVPTTDFLPGSIREDEIKIITKGYPEVTDSKALTEYSVRINIMKTEFKKANKRDMKYGDVATLIVEPPQGEKGSKREFILFCDSKKKDELKFRLFAQP